VKLDEANFIRQRLYAGDKSNFRRYAELVLGEASLLSLLHYECVTGLLGPLPGALGLFLRKFFYPRLFGRVGRRVVFGRNLVIRNGRRIRLGERVVIDDNCVLDARGAGEEGIAIGDDVIINRGAVIVAKAGSIQVGARCDIGANASVISQGGVAIGEDVAIAGSCMIGGGLIEKTVAPGSGGAADSAAVEGAAAKTRISKGPIRIDDGCTLFQAAIVLDGVHIGRGSSVGAGALVRESLPAGVTAAPSQRLVLLRSGLAAPPAASAEAQSVGTGTETEIPELRELVSAARATDGTASFKHAASGAVSADVSALREVVFQALAELNRMRPAGKRIPKQMDAALFGPGGPLDSMDLVNLIVGVEQKCEELLALSLNLSDPALMVEGRTPFASVGHLVECLASLLAQAGDHSA